MPWRLGVCLAQASIFFIPWTNTVAMMKNPKIPATTSDASRSAGAGRFQFDGMAAYIIMATKANEPT